MNSNWIAGIAIATLLAGGAVAQTVDSRTSTTTVTPSIGAVTTTKTQESSDSMGNKAETKQSTTTGIGGSATRAETTVKRADGSSETTYREQWNNAPVPVAPSTSSSTTTTTINR